MEKQRERRLTALMVADVVGYSKLMAADETGTHARLQKLRAELVDPLIAVHRGRLVKLMGDGALVEFASVVKAVACGIDIQEAVAKRNSSTATKQRITFRVGINLGDVIVEGDDLYGDSVNVAARLEQLARSGGICISRTVHDHIEGKLDARFADGGDQQVKNMAQPVHVFHWSPVAEAAAALSAGAGVRLALPDKPSLAVLPFENLSTDLEDEHLADAITEDLITMLSRVRWLFVIARNSTFTYKGRAVDVQEIAQDLGVRYVLEGSIRSADKRIRANVQLIEAQSRAQVWAERYDREVKDIFAFQDDLTEAIAGALEPELGDAERIRALRKRPESLDAWDAYQQGLWHVYRFRKEDIAKAIGLFDQALALDSHFAAAYSGKSLCHTNRVFLDLTDHPGEELKTAYGMAKRGVALDEKDPAGHWALARAHFFRREHDLAIAELETAINFNPSFAQAHFHLGWVLTYAGRAGEALPYLDNAFRLSPHDPLLFGFMSVRALTNLLMGRDEEALKWAGNAARHPAAHCHIQGMFASVLGKLGRIGEAKAVLSEILRSSPGYSCTMIERIQPFKHRRDLDLYLEGQRLAGIPE